MLCVSKREDYSVVGGEGGVECGRVSQQGSVSLLMWLSGESQKVQVGMAGRLTFDRQMMADLADQGKFV